MEWDVRGANETNSLLFTIYHLSNELKPLWFGSITNLNHPNILILTGFEDDEKEVPSRRLYIAN